MSRRRPHSGEKGRYGLPRTSVAVSGLNVRDIQDVFIRAVARCTKDQDLIENAEQGENGTLHRNHLFTINADDLDLAAVHDAIGEELEKLMGIFPNVKGAEPIPAHRRRATDTESERTHRNERPHPSLPEVRNLLPMPNVVPPRPEQGYVPDSVLQSDEQYNGWTEQEKLHGRMRALGIPVPREDTLWKRFMRWFG